ncbi:hypothetical protein [Sphingomonas rubra]|uniref:hypothetical protein n=1 Tax=Sphingomonas rubra TaxID=634430 RepID=UPI001FE1E243|nr:hypothetical protein [Sphingomonas rubra]
MKAVPRLSMMVEPESLLNDGVAAVGFAILVGIADGEALTASGAASTCRTSGPMPPFSPTPACSCLSAATRHTNPSHWYRCLWLARLSLP